MKKILTILFLLAATHASAQFIDVTQNHYAFNSIKALLEQNIIQIPSSRKFNGNDKLTRYELAYILDKILKTSSRIKEIESIPLDQFYTDIPAEHFAFQAVQDGVKLGIFIVTKEKKFAGNSPVNRYDFYSFIAAFIERIEGRNLPSATPAAGYSDIAPSHPAYPYIQKLIGAGLLEGKGNFSGEELISRYEMAVACAAILTSLSEDRKSQQMMGESYSDVPADNFAASAINELIKMKILAPQPEEKFYGESLINRYLLIDYIVRMIEKILLPKGGDLELANFSRGYKDVPADHFAYRSIQKMVALGVIPPGNRTELFHGDRRINRYQMVYFFDTAFEYVLRDILIFEYAKPALAYSDVPADHFVYDAIMKSIWLGAIEGGRDRKFLGEEFIDRYQLSIFAVDFLNVLTQKLEEAKELVYRKPVGYGFNVFLESGASFLQISNATAPGQEYSDLSAYQNISLSVDRYLGQRFQAYAQLTSSFRMGEAMAISSPYLSQAYVSYLNTPVSFQLGRINYFQGYSPFGNSIYLDATADMLLTNFDHYFFNLTVGAGKLNYAGDIKLDTNFGLANLRPKLLPIFSWLELNAGATTINNLPDPTFAAIMSTEALQTYGGAKINILNLFELAAEDARVAFSDPSYMSMIGTSTIENSSAQLFSLTYYSPDFGYSLSLGYLKIGDDYYLSNLLNQTRLFGVSRGCEAMLLQTKFSPSASQIVTGQLANVSQGGVLSKTVISGYYMFGLLEDVFLNVSLGKIMDNTINKQDQLNFSATFTASF